METPWRPEHAVTPELARALVEERFPDLAPARLASLGDGWDNSAFLVRGLDDEPWVFRFPRRSLAVELLETECAVLPGLAPRLPLPIPVPARRGEPALGYPWPFAGYRLLSGRTACVAALDDEARRRSAAPLGRFLAALHAFPAEEARRLGAGPDTIRRMDVAYRWQRTKERLAAAEAQGLVEDADAWDAVREAIPEGWRPGASHVVHGDLYARHLLVDDAGVPCGVIDWGDVHVGDPAVDLGVAHALLPPDAHDAFRAAYGDLDSGTWAAARLRALVSSTAILVYGHDVGDEALFREAVRSLRFLRAAV